MAITSQEIIDAYKETGSVWKAGKKLGIPGQTVHSRLKALNYQLAQSRWTAEELSELKELAHHYTIAEIASKLGRPYNGVALKLSRLGMVRRIGGTNRIQKLPRKTTWNLASVKGYIAEISDMGITVNKYSKLKNLPLEMLVRSIQTHQPEWWEQYAAKNAKKPKTQCPYCKSDFWPMSGKQMYCNRKCAAEARVDNGYFGGRRRETIGLAEGICQLCSRQNVKGLSSHHMIGKENDPENEYLIALCPGCHQIVTILGGRNFAGTPEVWESLIQLAMIRKMGHQKEMGAVFCSVEIEIIPKSKLEDYE